MAIKPSNMIKGFLLLLFSGLVFNVGLSQNGVEAQGSVDFYNTRNVKSIFDLGIYRIKVKGDAICFNAEHGSISSPTKYNNLYDEFNFNNIYQIEDSLSNVYHFRFGWCSYKDGETIFTNVKWIGDIRPHEKDDFIDFHFSVVDIDFVQFGKMTLCTIGDSQTWWDKAQCVRRYINESFDELIFIGSNTDVFGYGHEGEGGNSTMQLLERIDKIPKADYYTLLIGTNDWKGDVETTFDNILEVTNYLAALNPGAKILYITPIPTTNEPRDSFNIYLC